MRRKRRTEGESAPPRDEPGLDSGRVGEEPRLGRPLEEPPIGGTAPGPQKLGDTPAPALTLREHIRWLWGYWRPHRSVLIFLAFFTLVSATVTVAYPRVLGLVIDRFAASVGGGDARVLPALLILVLIMAARFVASLYPATRALMNARLERDIRDDVFGRLMKKDYRFNNAFRTGDVVTRLTDDLGEFPKIGWFGCSGIFRAVESSAKLLFCLVVMFGLSWKLTLMAVIPLPIMMYVFYRLRHRMLHYMKESQACVSRTNNLLEAVFTSIRIVKAFRGEVGQRRHLADILKERVRVLFGLLKLQMLLQSMDAFASRTGQMVVIAFGGFLVIRGEITIGTLFAFYIYLDMLAWPMMDVPFLFMAAQQAFVSMDRVEQIRAFPVADARAAGTPLRGIEDVRFENVSFSYNGRTSIEGVSFHVAAGGKVALVGPVASGKSTVLRLLAGILRPQQGRIMINGRPLNEIDWESYRRLIGYVPQEATLFSKTIEENVLFGRTVPSLTGEDAIPDESEMLRAAEPTLASRLVGDAVSEGIVAPGWRPLRRKRSRRDGTISPAELDARERAEEAWARRCLAVAQMESDLATLPDGAHTTVGQKGGLVSGGQKQRIAIARALAGSPQLLLLDDCTAALDARNEDRFWSDLEERFAGRTCFIVSHRLATIRRADVILVFEAGRLVDAGTHDELVVRCETYREFLQTERRREHLGITPGVA